MLYSFLLLLSFSLFSLIAIAVAVYIKMFKKMFKTNLFLCEMLRMCLTGHLLLVRETKKSKMKERRVGQEKKSSWLKLTKWSFCDFCVSRLHMLCPQQPTQPFLSSSQQDNTADCQLSAELPTEPRTERRRKEGRNTRFTVQILTAVGGTFWVLVIF